MMEQYPGLPSLEPTPAHDEQERLRVEKALLEAGRALSADLKPHELPARILEQLAQVVPYERGSLLMQEGSQLQGSQLRIVAQRGFPDDERLDLLFIPLREGDVYFMIASSIQPVLIDDVTITPGWQQVEWLPINHSWLGVPLFSKGNVVGMVSLTRAERCAFSRQDVLMATSFAMQASVAIENAILYEEITRFNQQLEQMVEQRTEELRQALSTLERMDRSKSDFIGVAAHELRTPLTVMKGYLGMIHNHPAIQSASGLAMALDGVVKGAERLYEVVNNMLDLVRIDNQVLDLKMETVSLSIILRRVQADYAPFLAQRKQELHLEGLQGLPLIQGDATLLLKVFQNIIINAIKYTPDGGAIRVTGECIQHPELGGCVQVVIRDSGIGIAPEHHERIFEKLYSTGKVALHSSGKAAYKAGGPGLGLTIARGIVLAHNGKVWVESEGHDEEKFPGSCFYIVLPVGS